MGECSERPQPTASIVDRAAMLPDGGITGTQPEEAGIGETKTSPTHTVQVGQVPRAGRGRMGETKLFLWP